MNETAVSLEIGLYPDTKLYNVFVIYNGENKMVKTPISTTWLATCLQHALNLDDRGYEEREIPEQNIIEFLPSFDRDSELSENYEIES